MSEDWAKIAADAAEGIKSVAPTDNGFICTLIQTGEEIGTKSDPLFKPDVKTAIIALDFDEIVRNRDGSLTETKLRTLTISTEGLGGVVPSKDDRVAIGVVPADVTDETETHTLGEVRPLAPAGVVVLYEADLVR